MSYEEQLNLIPEYNYLLNMFQQDDLSSVFKSGGSEIRHSNFLKYILDYESKISNKGINRLPLLKLIELLKEKDTFNQFNKLLYVDTFSFDNTIIHREYPFIYNGKQNYIDLLIETTINNINYVILIENKIEADLGDRQLERYKEYIDICEDFKGYEKVYVLLHPTYSDTKSNIILDSANKCDYISITYQNIYDYILCELINMQNDYQMQFILNFYIHTLSYYNSSKFSALINTKQEEKCLIHLFNNTFFLKMIDKIEIQDINSEEYQVYKNKRLFFITLFKKYIMIEKSNNELSQKLKLIINPKNRIYSFKYLNGESKSFNSITEFIIGLINDIIERYNILSMDEIISEESSLRTNKDKTIRTEEEFIKLKSDINNTYYSRNDENTKVIINGNNYYITKFPDYPELVKFVNEIKNKFRKYEINI